MNSNITRNDPPLLRQPDGITCGASALAMAAALLLQQQGKSLHLNVSEVGEMIGTNTRTGTTHENMAIGMQSFGLENCRSTGDEHAVAKIWNHVREGSVVALRTLTFGFPHWILAYRLDGDSMLINDPAQGKIKRSRAQVESLIKPRDWEYWPVSRTQKAHNIEIVSFSDLTHEFVNQALESVPQEYKKYNFGLSLETVADWDTSKALLVDGALAAFYLLAPVDIHTLHDRKYNVITSLESFQGRGVESSGLFVLPQFRGAGYARLLATLPQKMNFNYVFGTQFKEDGVSSPLLRGTLVAENICSWTLAQKFQNHGYKMPDPETMAKYGR